MRGTFKRAFRGNPDFQQPRRPLRRSEPERAGVQWPYFRFLKQAFSPTYRALLAPSDQAALTFTVAQLGQIGPHERPTLKECHCVIKAEGFRVNKNRKQTKKAREAEFSRCSISGSLILK